MTYEVEVTCDDGETVWLTVEAENASTIAPDAMNEARERGYKPCSVWFEVGR